MKCYLKFYELEEIKDALSYISFFANHKDEISFRRIINKPTRGISEKTQDKLMESAKSYGNSPYGEHLKAVAEGKIKY